jgi:hypothetical protein
MKLLDLLYHDVQLVLPFFSLLEESGEDLWIEATYIGLASVDMYDIVGMLVDLRSAMYFGTEPNTAIIVFKKDCFIENNNWIFHLDNLKIYKQENRFVLQVINYKSNLKISCQELSIYFGNVPNIGEISYDASEKERYLATTQNWNCEINLTHVNHYK